MKPSKLQAEIAQRKPFRSVRQEASLALARTTARVLRHYAATLDPHGMTPQQFNVLRILRGAGKDGLPTMEIGRRMVEQAPGTTRLIDRLIRKGWVERGAAHGDRRQVVCRITERGSAALAGADGDVAQADEEVLAPLSKAEVRELIRMMDAIRAGLHREPV